MARGEGRKNRTGAFGSVDRLATGYRARYYGPDGRRYKAPTMFLTIKDARAWLSIVQADIIKQAWQPPEAEQIEPVPKLTFGIYADDWLEHRDIKTRTREHYRTLLDDHLVPAFGALPIKSITPDDVRCWHTRMGNKTPTLRAHCYGLLRTILATAASDGKISANPCVIRGAGSVKRAKTIRPASLYEVKALAWEMPKQYRAMVHLAAWCALRFGELTELRRRDVVLTIPNDPDGDEQPEGVVRVERAVVRTEDGFMVTTPKSESGIRDVAIPPHLVAMVRDHLDEFAPAPNDLLFPADHGGHLAPATLYRRFYTARDRIDRPDLRWHDLRHTGARLAADTGATLVDLMARLGHSTPAAAMRYQHAAQERDKQIAAMLSKMATE